MIHHDIIIKKLHGFKTSQPINKQIEVRLIIFHMSLKQIDPYDLFIKNNFVSLAQVR